MKGLARTWLRVFHACFSFCFYSMWIEHKLIRKWLRLYEKMRRRLSKKVGFFYRIDWITWLRLWVLSQAEMIITALLYSLSVNGILLPKLFWPTLRKNCSSDREKLLKFEAEGQQLEKFLRSLEQFIQTVEGQNNFW